MNVFVMLKIVLKFILTNDDGLNPLNYHIFYYLGFFDARGEAIPF